MTRRAAVALAAVVLAAALSAPVAGGAATTVDEPGAQHAATAQSDAYAGTHVAFEADGSALADYSVGGEVVLANVSVAPRSQTDAGLGVGLDLSAVTDLAGVDLSLDTTTSTRAEVATESGAALTAHDAERGILTVDAGGEAHVVDVDLAGEADARAQDEDRVVVDGNRSGAFVVAGDGEVAVDGDGDVTADLGEDATLVFRSYEGERDEDDADQEEMIAAGTVTAEVYADERDGELAADAATYAEDLAVDASNGGEQRVELTVDRTRSEGTVIVASVSEAAVGTVESAEDVNVTVDGEVAAEASSRSALEGGVGEEPRYMVAQSGEASASADVLVAVDHFSEREVAIQGDDSAGDGGDGAGVDDETGSDDATAGGDETPGFGIVAGLLALLGAAARVARA